jgi:hypothetical protein
MPTPCPKPEKRQPKEKKPLKRVGKPNLVSSKRMIQNAEYKIAREEYLSEYVVCEVKECMHPSEQIHHKKGRTGSLLTDKRFFLAVCAYCHAEIENKPEWAKKMGYSLNRI